MKPRFAGFDIDVFRSAFYLSIAPTIEGAIKILPKGFHGVEMGCEDGAALMIHDGEGGFAIALTYEHIDQNTLSHELFHVTIDMLDRVKIPVTTDNDESGAHLMGWLTEISVNQLRKWGVKL